MYGLNPLLVSFHLILICLLLLLHVDLDKIILRQFLGFDSIFILILLRLLILNVSDDDGQRGVEEGLEEG